jgi:RNA ligase (TIGR02306 family)
MERKLASVQQVKEIKSIPDADRIEVITVLGWHVVVQKNIYKVGDKVVYFEVDSCLPHDNILYGDLEKSGYRVKTLKFRGQISQGFVKKLSELNLDESIEIGTNVTNILGVKKYELPDEYKDNEFIKGPFPGYIHKTGEIRIQTLPDLLEEFKGTRCYVTEKMDGTSASFSIREEEYKICSHEKEINPEKNSCYKFINEKYDLETKIRSFGKNITIQGEICGPGICKNKYQLKEYDFFVFDIFDSDNYDHLPLKEVYKICEKLGLKTVPIISDNYILPDNIDEIVEFSKEKSTLCDTKREGLVIRSYEEKRNLNKKYELTRLSFKVINPEYSLKRGN